MNTIYTGLELRSIQRLLWTRKGSGLGSWMVSLVGGWVCCCFFLLRIWKIIQSENHTLRGKSIKKNKKGGSGFSYGVQLATFSIYHRWRLPSTQSTYFARGQVSEVSTPTLPFGPKRGLLQRLLSAELLLPRLSTSLSLRVRKHNFYQTVAKRWGLCECDAGKKKEWGLCKELREVVGHIGPHRPQRPTSSGGTQVCFEHKTIYLKSLD